GFGYMATGFYEWRLDTIPESRRYALEFSLFFMLLLLEMVRIAAGSADRMVRHCAWGAAALLVLWEAPPAYEYLKHGWDRWDLSKKEETIEYKVADRLAAEHPAARVFVSG